MTSGTSSPDFIPHELRSLELSLPIFMFPHKLSEHLLSPLDALTPVHLSANLPLAVLPRRQLRVIAVHSQFAYKLSPRSVPIRWDYKVNHLIII
jgi:hypothetical protein